MEDDEQRRGRDDETHRAVCGARARDSACGRLSLGPAPVSCSKARPVVTLRFLCVDEVPYVALILIAHIKYVVRETYPVAVGRSGSPG